MSLSAAHAAGIEAQQRPSFTALPPVRGERWKRAAPICPRDEAKAQGGLTLPPPQNESRVKALGFKRGEALRYGIHFQASMIGSVPVAGVMLV